MTQQLSWQVNCSIDPIAISFTSQDPVQDLNIRLHKLTTVDFVISKVRVGHVFASDWLHSLFTHHSLPAFLSVLASHHNAD